MHLQVEKDAIQISQTNFSEGILLSLLLEKTKGYNLQKVICLGGRTHWGWARSDILILYYT